MAATSPATRDRDADGRIVIVGAGFGGLAAAIELRRAGFDEISVLEAGEDLGGTWLYNDYPGAACDVPGHAYSFSFAQRRDWSRRCSLRDEILDYMRRVAARHRVSELIECSQTVTRCELDRDRGRWLVATADGGVREAHALVLAVGQLNRPRIPRLAGLDSFAGHSFHSARWDHAYDLRGRRVAVVGTGASAVQFIPEIAPVVARLDVFQRSASWLLPRRNRVYPPHLRRLLALAPGLQRLRRAGMFAALELLTASIRNPRTLGRLLAARSAMFMRSQLSDPELRRRAWPDYTFGCKRVLFSSRYLPALSRPNVRLICEPIRELTPAGPRTADGVVHEVDCIIWATGFQTQAPLEGIEISGADGRRLADAWAHGPYAHLGITVPGFPSMFLMYGPNTNTSGGSIIFFLEAQARYIRQALVHSRSLGWRLLDVRPEVAAAFDAETQARFAGTAWLDCASWYRNERGRIVANWPGYMREYRRATASFRPSDYVLFGPAVAPTPPDAGAARSAPAAS
ncbi:MAG TPA: NAD(P)/FAD-dependent oxidoreductase [Solirubrobacteraceae bacterium]|nr:NAD(P)/FAD-dependent oxidoreductase [Solirubrobacteraceae bacterium]